MATNNATNNYFDYPPTFIQGCNLINFTSTTIAIDAGIAKSSLGVYNIVNGSTKPLDMTTSGAGGLDTGTVNSNTIYAAYLIAKSSDNTVSALASLATVTPTVPPPGYDQYRRVGWIITNNTGSILSIPNYGGNNEKTYYYNGPGGTAAGSGGMLFVNGGSSTSPVSVDISAYIPFPCLEVVLQVLSSGSVGAVYIKCDTSSNYVTILQNPTSGLITFEVPLNLSPARKFTYQVQSGSIATFIELVSFKDSLF